jgi:hypothetical protein
LLGRITHRPVVHHRADQAAIAIAGTSLRTGNAITLDLAFMVLRCSFALACESGSHPPVISPPSFRSRRSRCRPIRQFQSESQVHAPFLARV